jgi:hypothetical protein
MNNIFLTLAQESFCQMQSVVSAHQEQVARNFAKYLNGMSAEERTELANTFDWWSSILNDDEVVCITDVLVTIDAFSDFEVCVITNTQEMIRLNNTQISEFFSSVMLDN